MDTASLIDDPSGQSVRLPDGFRFPGNKVFVNRVGSALVLLPENSEWQPLFDSLKMFTSDYMSDRMQPPHQQRDEWPQ